MLRSSVDLPQPDGPMSAVTWLGNRHVDVEQSPASPVVETEVVHADEVGDAVL
jgi:hypothetical protein